METWMQDALCRDADPDLFFPDPRGCSYAVQEALRICRECPVRGECLKWAFKVDDRFAILGGLTSRQRSRIRNKVRKIFGAS
jgi:WhiB family redox-sensing transcriptional regulator